MYVQWNNHCNYSTWHLTLTTFHLLFAYLSSHGHVSEHLECSTMQNVHPIVIVQNSVTE